MSRDPGILIRKSCPYSNDQLVEAANVGFADQFKIKTRGRSRTVGPLSVVVGWGKSKVDTRDPEWLAEVAADRAKE